MTRQRLWIDALIVVAGASAVKILVDLYVLSKLVLAGLAGNDYRIYIDAAQRWLDGGSYFLPRQLEGPYNVQMGDVLYPPTALWLFVPFTRLPWILWWAIPAAIIAAAIWRLRPAPWALVASLALFVFPLYLGLLLNGNPVMWVVAALSAAVAWGTPASLALFKPHLFLFALFGIRRREWWYGVIALVVLTLPLLPLTLTWVGVVLRTHLPAQSYVDQLPLGALPMLWWFASRREDAAEGGAISALRRFAAGRRGLPPRPSPVLLERETSGLGRNP